MLTTLIMFTALSLADGGPPPPTKADIQAAIESNDLDSAASALNQLIEQDSKNLEALVALALLEMERGRFSQAAKLFEQILELDPWDDDSRLNLVEAHWRAGAPGKAKAVLAHLLRRHPKIEEGLSIQAQLAEGKSAPSRPSPWRKLIRLSLDVGFDSNYGYDSNFDGDSEVGPSDDLLGIEELFGKKSAVGTMEVLAGVNHLGRTRPITAYARLKTQQSIGQFDAFRDVMPTIAGLQVVGRKPLGPINTQLHLSYNELFTGLFDTHYHRLFSAVSTANKRMSRYNRLRLATAVDYRMPEERTSDTTVRISLRDSQRIDKFTVSVQGGFRANYATDTINPAEVTTASHDIDFVEYSGALFVEYRFSRGLSAFSLFDVAKRTFDSPPGSIEISDTTLFNQTGLVVEFGDFEFHGEYAFSKNSSSFPDERNYNRHQLNAGVRYWYD